MSHAWGEPRFSNKFYETMHVGDDSFQHPGYVSMLMSLFQLNLRVKQRFIVMGVGPSGCRCLGRDGVRRMLGDIAADTSRLASNK